MADDAVKLGQGLLKTAAGGNV